jgi:NAD(P)-dependent dehydrogenase (short-subunit alcohol dehydrogenase family)
VNCHVLHDLTGAVATGLTSSGKTGSLVEAAVAELGRMDVLVENASAVTCPGTLLEFREKHRDRIFDTSCGGAFLPSRAVARRMIDQE